MWRFPTIIPVQDTDSQQQLPIDAIFKTAENSTVGIITGSNDGPNPEFDEYVVTLEYHNVRDSYFSYNHM